MKQFFSYYRTLKTLYSKHKHNEFPRRGMKYAMFECKRQLHPLQKIIYMTGISQNII